MNRTTVTAVSAQNLAGLWAEVLGVASIGADDELAEYGPDSLDTARVIARIRRSYGLDVPFRLAYEAPTPRALADALESLPSDARASHRSSGGTSDAHTPGETGKRALWPLSYDQQRLWLLDQHGGSDAYHVRVVLELRGDLDAPGLERAWGAVVARHGSLRTRFVVDGHEPRQEVLASWPATLPVAEVPGLDEALDRVAELAATAFDLAAAPPWRAVLYRLAADHHVLAFVIHHIVFDGWSEEVLRRELSELYAAELAGRVPDLPELTVAYVDHAVWQRGLDHETELGYWRRQLAGVEPLELPADRPRPPSWTSEGAGHSFTIDADLATAMRNLARAHGATPFMALLAAWTALLGRLCDVSDVVVGASTADRDRPELEDLIGMFVNVLMIRAEAAGRRSFTDLLGAVRETTLDAFAHRAVPFERLVAELAPDRRTSPNPLFNVNFVYLNMPMPDDGWPGLAVRPLATPARSTAFDLILAVQDRPDGTLGCYLEYSTVLFDAATIERIGGYYERLLAGIVADPAAPIGLVDILGAAERRELTESVPMPPPHGRLHAVIERWARQTPAATAVTCGGVQLSYADLDARANRLARHLRGQGVGPETAVAVWLPRSAGQLVAMLAVWKAGGFTLPLDDEHPAERIAMMLADAAPLVLITRRTERIAAGERTGVAKVVCLDRDGADIDAQPATAPGVTVAPDALAAAIYTSGSTGTPKAVALTHRNVLSALAGRAAFEAPPRCTLLPVSFAFDVFLSFAAWTLCAGGELVVPVQLRGADLDELATLLNTRRVTHLVGPPDLQRALLGRHDVRAANSLVLGVVGGQSCPQVLAEDYARSTAGARLVNEYGLTETSAGTHYVTDGRDDAGPSGGQLPIGWPAAGFAVYLLDANLAPVPVGVSAELYLGGAGIARGYLDRPAATAERFMADPYGPPGSRLYRTGDLARRRSDGRLEFLGRRDRQVKVRGYRIELAEVEAALLRHETVGTTAVCYLPERQELAAYVVGAAGAVPSGDELREHLRRLLPEPMVPSAFVVLAAMPLTPNGKIDRAALVELGVEQPTLVTHTAPRTPAERKIAAVWAEALERDQNDIDVHADFFKIGGHSLLAATVVSRLRAEFPVPIGMQDLFAAPTVAGLAELLDERITPETSGVQRTERGNAGPETTLSPLNAEGGLVSLGRLVAEQVRRTPDAPAVWAGGRWATYAEFAGGVHRLAGYLREAGVGVDDVVGVCLPRSGSMVTAVHAVTMAGGAYLPLPPDLPAVRLAMMIEDARPAVVITTAELAVRLGDIRLVCLDTEQDAIAAANPVETDVPLDALAYVMFTSGSTGRPKGVGVSHRAIADRLRWMQATYPLDAGDRVLFKTPFSFDVSVPELYWPLITGAGLVVVDDGDHRDFGHLLDVAAATGVTTAQFVPSILALFLDEPGVAGRLGSLRRVLCAGEALGPDLVARFHAVLPHVELHNLYGPTEAAVYASFHPCADDETTVPIGRPLADTRLEVLDPHLERVETGELCIGGGQLARGYLGQPALTAERFVAAPNGERLYRTGDLARRREDGTVEYLGRLDHQVKIRGVRIEPAEIELALRSHPRIGGAAVQPWRPPGGDTRLVAYVVCSSGDAPTAGELRAFLAGRLPAAMIPSRFVVLPSFPLTPSGKLDRRALPSPEAAARVEDGPVRSLVWLRSEGPQPPLFCVHSGDGAVDWYGHLAQALGEDQPLAAFGWPAGGGTVEEVARRYLAELREERPAGPYRLFGWCGGATVAWELARLLDSAGERVELWLLDPVVDVAQRSESARQLAMFRRSEALFDALDAELDRHEADRRRADLVEFVRLSIGDPGVPVTADGVRARVRASRELLEAGIEYGFRSFPCRLHLLISDDIPAEEHVVIGGEGYGRYLERWCSLATGRVDLRRVAGDHYGLLRPPRVATLAGQLAADLVEARA